MGNARNHSRTKKTKPLRENMQLTFARVRKYRENPHVRTIHSYLATVIWGERRY